MNARSMNGGGPPELPRVLADTTHLGIPRHTGAPAAPGELGPDAAIGGAVWNLAEPQRDLDSNVITLPPGDGIGAHTGPDHDVLIHVLAGTGTLGTEGGPVHLRTGLLVWLPRGSHRQFSAGPDGLTYLTVHRRRPDQGLWPARAPS